MDILKKYGLCVPAVLLPSIRAGGDLSSWAVVACDQYTQDKAYWQEAGRIAGTGPSALHIVLPEIYLNELSETEKEKAAADIQKKMTEYLNGGVFAPPVKSCVYVERTTAYGRLRKGLIVCIDLEEYEWEARTKAKIRATEATITERIPPRIKIRKNAPLETPHIMLLINDTERSFVEKTGELAKKQGRILYDTDLMQGAGHICGRQVTGDEAFAHMEQALAAVAHNNTDTDGSVFLFAVGDGNHSLATAKAVWDELKKSAGATADKTGRIALPECLHEHPARYALVEIVNLYDEGLTFEPIHRLIFDGSARELAEFVRAKLGGTIEVCSDAEDLRHKTENSVQAFGFASADDGFLYLKAPLDCLAVSAIQPVLDEFIYAKTADGGQNGGEHLIDYIHGAKDVLRFAQDKNKTAVLLPPIAKDSFFATIKKHGSLPRKSFSMGEASEKRFYLECRSLLPC